MPLWNSISCYRMADYVPRPTTPGLFSLPVVFQERDLLPIRHCEAIFWSLIPIDIINPIGTVVVSGYDYIANQKLGALILEVFFVLLIHGMPLERNKRRLDHFCIHKAI